MSNQLSEHVQLTITADTVGQARAGFGVPLIISHSAAWTERTRTYRALPDVAEDFAAGTPEYLSAQALFSQSPHPEQVVIGRASLKPTQVYVIGVNVVADSTKYDITLVQPGATVTNPLEYTSDTSPTNDEIVAGIAALLNGVTGKNYAATVTGTTGSQVCTVTGSAAGNWFSLQIDPTFLTIKQTHADPGIATDLTAISNENDAWYVLHTTFNSKAYVLAAAAAIEATGSKLYILDVNETDSINIPVGSSPTDTLYSLFALSYNRTAGAYYPSPATMFSAAWMGRVLPDEPGSETWKGKTLADVVAVNLTSTQRVNLRARKANCYTTIGSENKTWEGTVAGGTFGFIDVTRGLDWVYDDMQKRVFDDVFSGEKLPFTDAGVAVVRNAVKTTIKTAIAKGIFSEDAGYEVQVPKVGNVSSSNKAIRTLPDVKWSATLAGAIHDVKVNGVVSV